MVSNTAQQNEHVFSIQLKSKKYVKNFSFCSTDEGEVVIEGLLGRLKGVDLIEGVMHEINGENGDLRMDLSEEKLKKLLLKHAFSKQPIEAGK